MSKFCCTRRTFRVLDCRSSRTVRSCPHKRTCLMLTSQVGSCTKSSSLVKFDHLGRFLQTTKFFYRFIFFQCQITVKGNKFITHLFCLCCCQALQLTAQYLSQSRQANPPPHRPKPCDCCTCLDRGRWCRRVCPSESRAAVSLTWPRHKGSAENDGMLCLCSFDF